MPGEKKIICIQRKHQKKDVHCRHFELLKIIATVAATTIELMWNILKTL
jgi:hypothetical protein